MHGFRLPHNTGLPSSLKRGTIYHFYHAYQLCFYTCMCSCMWMYVVQCSLNIYIGIWCHDGSSWNVRLNVVQQVNEAPICNKFEIRRVAHLPGNFFIAFEFFTWIFLHFWVWCHLEVTVQGEVKYHIVGTFKGENFRKFWGFAEVFVKFGDMVSFDVTVAVVWNASNGVAITNTSRYIVSPVTGSFPT